VTWVAWRLQRTETLIAAGVLVLLAALLVPTGIQMAHAYHHDGIAACLAPNNGFACGNKIAAFENRFLALNTLGDWFTLIPGLIGVMLAAPFIFDLEHRTYRLAWTQSITRGRWLLGKLGLPVATAAVAAGGLSLLFSWWRAPQVHVNGHLDTGNYDTTGTVLIGYTLFGFALAVALGAVWRRAAASLTVAFVAYFAIRLAVDFWLRSKLVSPLHATWTGPNQPKALWNAHVLSIRGTVNGHEVVSGSGGFLGGHVSIGVPDGAKVIFHAVYQPESHYWPLQLTETGLFVGLAALLIGLAAWWTHARAA
jgi:hypothetical protein